MGNCCGSRHRNPSDIPKANPNFILNLSLDITYQKDVKTYFDFKKQAIYQNESNSNIPRLNHEIITRQL